MLLTRNLNANLDKLYESFARCDLSPIFLVTAEMALR